VNTQGRKLVQMFHVERWWQSAISNQQSALSQDVTAKDAKIARKESKRKSSSLLFFPFLGVLRDLCGEFPGVLCGENGLL